MKPLLMSLLSVLVMGCCCQGIAQNQQTPPAFNHLYLAVRNIDSSLKFYTKAFDLRVTDHFNQLEITQSDSNFKRSVKIVFLKFPGQDFVYELAERVDPNDTTRQGNLFGHVGVEVKDIVVAVQRAIDAGGKLYIPVRRVRTSSGLEIKQAFLRGPDGESIELAQIVTGNY
jgi:lactoylglutathione lyase